MSADLSRTGELAGEVLGEAIIVHAAWLGHLDLPELRAGGELQVQSLLPTLPQSLLQNFELGVSYRYNLYCRLYHSLYYRT